MTSIPAQNAFAQSTRNPHAKWPTSRDAFAPYCAPGIMPGFSLEPGESIFTIGSCFARNIEFALRARGYVVPCLDFTAPSEEAWDGNPVGMLNKYTPAGMLNEVRYALAPETCPDFLVDWKDGVLDLQLHIGAPVSRARGIERRGEVGLLYRRAITQSRIVIVTLGLVEAWWDTEAGCYLNHLPTWPVVAAHPGRFQFEVLSFAQCHAMVRELVEMLRDARGTDLRLMLTVSPVPLLRTFTDQDVMSANAYSKSALRTVAGEIAGAYDFIDYYPSFESVMLSDPSVAWEEDQRHVAGGLIRHNVERMIESYSAAPIEKID